MTTSSRGEGGGVCPPLADLHLHTTASDGQLSPGELIERVAGTTLRVVAITDHDSTAGVGEARAAARGRDLEVVPGLELGTEDGATEIHLVAHFLDPEAPGLQEFLETLRAGRVDAARRTVEKLRDLGVRVDWQRVLQIAGGAVGRPHIARAMEEAGYVDNAQDAFQRYLGTHGAARVKRPKPTPVDGLRFLHSVGAAVTLAHPQTVNGLPRTLGFLVDEGLDGIEVFAPKYGTSDRSRWLELADRHGLIPGGGSDYHAWGARDEIVPGRPSTVGPPLDTVERLREAAARWRAVKRGVMTPALTDGPSGEG